MVKEVEFTKSSGNIFADLGLANPEERLAKANLALKIIDISKERGFTQKKTAHILGIDQPKVSALYRGRLSGFSVERLIKFLILLEQDVDIVVRAKADRRHPVGHLNVLPSGSCHAVG